MSLRVAVTAPVNFNSQEAIRRMVGKGIVPYVGDPSAIQKMLEKLYEPEDLDLSDLPTFSSLEDLIEVGNEIDCYCNQSPGSEHQSRAVAGLLLGPVGSPYKIASSPFSLSGSSGGNV